MQGSSYLHRTVTISRLLCLSTSHLSVGTVPLEVWTSTIETLHLFVLLDLWLVLLLLSGGQLDHDLLQEGGLCLDGICHSC